MNGDDLIDLNDADMIARAVVGLVTLTPEQEFAADVDGDGEVTAHDAALIAKYVQGLIDRFPAGE